MTIKLCELINLIMNSKLPVKERVFILQQGWLHDHNYEDVVESFMQCFPNSKPLSRQAIYNLNKKFQKTRPVAVLPRSGRPKSVTTVNINTVPQTFIQSLSKSTRRAQSQ